MGFGTCEGRVSEGAYLLDGPFYGRLVPTLNVGLTEAAVQGGAEVLGFATQGEKSSRYTSITSLAGVISTSPLIEQATPAPRLLRWAGGKASILAPHMSFPAGVNPAVRYHSCCVQRRLCNPRRSQDLSHDSAFNDAYAKDPLIKPIGTLRGLHDMLSHVSSHRLSTC